MRPIKNNDHYFLRKQMLHRWSIWLCLCICVYAPSAFAQINSAARYEINAKRIGVNPASNDALPRSREFIRLDSTYYVGYMYEGLYKYNRSSDYLGYKQAIAPLRKALALLEKDYGQKLQTLYTSFQHMDANRIEFEDFYVTANTLYACYSSIEMPDSAMALLNKIDSYHFQRDFFNVGSSRAWLYHRNRFYTSKDHPFLKNSIQENEEEAFKQCYSQLAYINANRQANNYWYGDYASRDDELITYHYLALLYDYNQNYDSSRYYYSLLIAGDRVSWSNYANMEHVVGDFANAVMDYSKQEYKQRFALVESDYYLPMLFVYADLPKTSIAIAQEKITESGSIPGFGWYNIALARGYLYDGQLDSCELFLNKAANFKELHINTTLTQSQYEFTINLLRIQLIDKKMSLVKFFNSGWWYSLSGLYEMCALKAEKLLLEYALVNAMVNNPERDKLVYELFCSEATVSFDESMYLLKDFCLPFFEKKYRDYAQQDTRPKINRYFRLNVCRFLQEQGEDDEARRECEKLMNQTIPFDNSETGNDDQIDFNYEKLYAYRVFEIMTKTSSGKDYQLYRNNCFEAYPQLMLFSEVPMEMNVSFEGMQNDPVIRNVISDLSDCNIELSNKDGIPSAHIQFNKIGDTYQAIINVISANNKTVVANGELLFKKEEGIGRELAMRLFGKGGAVKPEPAVN
ncbi:MAG: hypothetical protein HY062_12475 [Bacteroidetes bacterium]|nr:hypothetical protein [Bacteroidota bacterium]